MPKRDTFYLNIFSTLNHIFLTYVSSIKHTHMSTISWRLRCKTENYASTGFYISVQSLCMHICAFVQTHAFKLDSTPGFMHHSRKVCFMFRQQSGFSNRNEMTGRINSNSHQERGKWMYLTQRQPESTLAWAETTHCFLSGSLATLD